MSERPKNYTTKIEPRQSVAECQELLADAGAAGIAVEFTDRIPSALSFRLETPRGVLTYVLPVNIDGMRKVLTRANFDSLHTTAATVAKYRTREHAARVAWRVVRDWLDAQLALVAAEIVQIDEVMIPYLAIGEGGWTVRDAYRESGPRALTGGQA